MGADRDRQLEGHRQPTALKALLTARHWQKYATFRKLYDKTATGIDKDLDQTAPSRGQFARWLAGQLVGLPHPDACRVLEAMLPGWSVHDLFAPAATFPDVLTRHTTGRLVDAVSAESPRVWEGLSAVAAVSGTGDSTLAAEPEQVAESVPMSTAAALPVGGEYVVVAKVVVMIVAPDGGKVRLEPPPQQAVGTDCRAAIREALSLHVTGAADLATTVSGPIPAAPVPTTGPVLSTARRPEVGATVLRIDDYQSRRPG